MDKPSEPIFNFVNLTHPDQLKDKETRSRVRRLAMTEVGKARRKPKSRRARNEITLEIRSSEGVQSTSSSLDRLDGGEVDPFTLYPIELDASSRNLVANIFSRNSPHATMLRSSWWNVGLHDAATFYIVLANSQAYIYMHLKRSTTVEKDPLSLSLHAKSLHLVSQRINDPDQQTSNELIGAVAGFMCHNYIVGDFEAWEKHANALVKMIDMRGGIDSIDQKELQITLSWCDLCGAAAQDILPQIAMPTQWISDSRSPSSSPRPHSSVSLAWKQQFPMQSDWISIFDDLNQLISLDRVFTDVQLKAATTIGSWMEPTIFRLLSVRPLQRGNDRGNVIEEVCRLGTLLFLAPVWRYMGSSPVWTFSFTRKLLVLLNAHAVNWNELRPFLVWCVYLAAIEAGDPGERSQFIYMLAVLMRGSQLTEWDELMQIVKSVLWIERVFGKSDKAIREETMGIAASHVIEAVAHLA